LKRKSILYIFLLLVFGLWGYLTLHHSPPVSRLASLRVPVTEETVVLGAEDLGQRSGFRSAARRHLALRRQDGAWRMANISLEKKMDVRTDLCDTLYLKRLALEPGDRIEIARSLVEVASVSADTLVLTLPATGETIQWKNGELVPDGQTPDSWLSLPKQSWRWWLRGAQKETILFSLGGSVNLYDNRAIRGVAVRGVWVTWRGGRFFLAPGKEGRVLLHRPGREAALTFHDAWLPLDGLEGKVSRVVLGSTFYSVASGPDALELTPVAGMDVFRSLERHSQTGAGFVADDHNLSWIGGGMPAWEWVRFHRIKIGVALGLGLLWALIIWHLGAYYDRKIHGGVYLSCFLITALVVSWEAGAALDLAWPLALCWLIWVWATWMLLIHHRLNHMAGSIWLAAICLAGTGVLLHLQLLAGADNTRWITFAWKQIFWISICGWVIGLAGCVSIEVWKDWFHRLGDRYRRWVDWVCIIAYGLFLVLLSVMAALGNEQGLGPFQPSELMKLVLVALAAVTAVDFLEARAFVSRGSENTFLNWTWMALVVGSILILMTVAAGISLWWVRDISPLLIILAFFLFWFWKISCFLDSKKRVRKPKRIPLKRCIRSVLVLLTGIVLVLAWCIHSAPQAWSWIHQHERFAVWSQPERHPFSGAQVITAMHMAGHGGWWGAESSWFGPNQAGNRLPAVQDDFALSFLLYKFGGIAGLILLYVQVSYLILLWRCGAAALFFSDHYAERRSGRILCFVLQGLVIVHLLQWAIAWGNSLGLLPVMAQPMTWLSSGNSHLLFVGLPALFLGLGMAWISENRDTE